jgi:hypothetical protein
MFCCRYIEYAESIMGDDVCYVSASPWNPKTGGSYEYITTALSQ